MTPIRLLHLEAAGFLYALAGIIGYQLLTRRIDVAGLLSQKSVANPVVVNQISPGRIQLLLATIAAAAGYLGQVATSTSGTMPDVSADWLYVLGSSSGIYALEKVWAIWNGKKKS